LKVYDVKVSNSKKRAAEPCEEAESANKKKSK